MHRQGKITIGVGRNLDDNGLSDDEIALLLHNDIQKVYNDLDRNFKWYQKHSMVRQNVFESMCFQMGINRLKTFKNFLHYFQSSDYSNAAKEMLDSKWAKTNSPNRAKRLADMMDTGILDKYYE